MTNTTHLALPYLDAAQAQKHVTHNDALRMLDALVQLSVAARNVVSAPGSPTEGGRWLVGAGATGAFAGNANNVAAFQDGVWRFFVPQKGWRAYAESEGLILLFDGTSWNDIGLSIHTLQNLTELGIGTNADTTNILSAKLNNALFTAKATSEGGTGDLRYTLNKSAASNTVSQLYQDNYSGRAEIGQSGDDNFHFKVSSDGAAWYDALILSNAAGDKFAPAGGFVVGNNAFFSTASASGGVTPLSQVQGTGSSASFLSARFSNDANGARVFFAKSRGASVATHGAVATGDDLGGISLSGSDGTAMRHGGTIKAVAAGSATSNGTPTKLQFDTSDGTAAPADRMEIGPNGNVGIGAAYPTTGNARLLVSSNSGNSPVALSGTVLQVTGADNAAGRLLFESFGAAGNAQMVFRAGNGTAVSPTALTSGKAIGGLAWFGYGATGFSASGRANISAVAAETWTDTTQGSYMSFYTCQIGTAALAERVRILDSGAVLIGNTTGTDLPTVAGNAVPSADNAYTCGKSGARWASVWAANGTIQTSDSRDKTIVERVGSADAAAIVDAVQPVKFRWKIGGYDERCELVPDASNDGRHSPERTYSARPGRRIHAGFIAQEIKAAMDISGGDFGAWGLEDAGDPDSRQFLRPDQLIPILWEALRETRRELADLKRGIGTS
ncbi:MAG: DUF2793 domain-containing protein [Methylobacteriaceae bacterium]|nr:DUF2793 domain-containing protein [Methylobacteriaceae bacterium]